MKKVMVMLVLLVSLQSNAEPINSTIGHLYWGLGPNFSMLGNIRLGAGSVEVGLIQGLGFGVMFVSRTSTPLFYQIGPVSTSGGFGIVGGGGYEWNTSSFFRFRTDITVSTDAAYQTQSFVSFGGVFIL